MPAAYLHTTTIDGAPYRVVAWAPPVWGLPIREQIVTFIWPVELPPEVTQPEQVSDEIVDGADLAVAQYAADPFDRWVYYRIFDTIAGEVRVPAVSFTGGQPTLRPDPPALIACAKSPRLRANLIANGIRCGANGSAFNGAAFDKSSGLLYH